MRGSQAIMHTPLTIESHTPGPSQSIEIKHGIFLLLLNYGRQ